MNPYFDFLYSVVGRKSEYRHLLEELHELRFYSLVPNDDNREADGIQLRNKFIDEMSPTKALSFPQECTILEMLIGVAYRIEFELLGGRYERPAKEWFWVLINNLGIGSYTNDKFKEDTRTEMHLENRMEIFLERQYSHDGEGGLFPLNHAEKDQRRVEIWYQMSTWIIENYPIF